MSKGTFDYVKHFSRLASLVNSYHWVATFLSEHNIVHGTHVTNTRMPRWFLHRLTRNVRKGEAERLWLRIDGKFIELDVWDGAIGNSSDLIRDIILKENLGIGEFDLIEAIIVSSPHGGIHGKVYILNPAPDGDLRLSLDAIRKDENIFRLPS